LSKKILDYCKDIIPHDNTRSVFAYEFPAYLWEFLTGNWEQAKPYDEKLLNENLKIGNILFASGYTAFHIRLLIEQGKFIKATELLTKLEEIGYTYEHNYPKIYHYVLKGLFYMKSSRYKESLGNTMIGIQLAKEHNFEAFLFILYTLKAKMEFKLGDLEDCEQTITLLYRLKSESSLVPLYLSSFWLCVLPLRLHQMETAKKTGERVTSCDKIAREAVKVSRRIASDRTEAYRLMGTYYWLRGKCKKAVKWWVQSLRTGEELEAIPELTHTHAEILERLNEKQRGFDPLKQSQREELIKCAEAFLKNQPGEKT
jgi:tetratricopeptide (TPR) repeat protein